MADTAKEVALPKIGEETQEGVDNSYYYDVKRQPTWDVNGDHKNPYPKGIKKEDSMDGVLTKDNPAY